MNVTQINDIRISAAEFRYAIQQCDASELPFSLSDFPVGSCSDASMLLGTYFKDKGLGDFYFVEGRLGDGDNLETHYWLEHEDMIVDITADQFDGIGEEIIISFDSEWHNLFDKKKLQVADYRLIDAADVRNHLGAVYEYVLSNINF